MEQQEEQQDIPMVEPQGNTDESPEPLLEPVADDQAEPMEGVAPITEVEAADEVKPAEEALPDEYTWEVNGFSNLPVKYYSEPFELAGYPWRILIFPRGNKADFLSVYLDCADASNLAPGWQRKAQFKILIVNQLNEAESQDKGADHTFTQGANDWGFTQFLPLADLRDANRGFLLNDRLIIKVQVKVHKIVVYDSKKETGFVGIKNQGATCYMNSLLQTLYNINYFRQAVYHMPTTEEDMPDKSIPLALQSLFHKLQFGLYAVSTKDLTKSFGWDTYESLQQHDVQELNRVLCEKLEEKMKGTKVEGVINKLFEGHTYNFIECVNIEYKSTRRESFMDLQLDVKGCKDVYDSFDRYTEVELLDGQNQYNAEGHGLQDARKGVLFDEFPPVLQLQLKRFEYDFQRDMMVKINDRYEFPEELDLDRGEGRYLSPNADRTVRNKYRLHSVLVHSGGVHGGHYYAFIRPDGSQWLKFDDDKVTKEDKARALNDQFGGEDEMSNGPTPGLYQQPLRVTKYSNAYMLVYVRESDWPNIMCECREEDLQEHVRARLKAEADEKERRRKEKSEAHLYTYIRVATDEDLRQQLGNCRHFDLVDHDKVKTYKIPKNKPFTELKQQVCDELGVPLEMQRYWTWARRQNHTFRPNRPLTPDEEQQEVLALKEAGMRTGATQQDLRLFLETPQPAEGQLHARSKMEMLLFFKEYDPVAEKLRFAGRLFAHKHTKVGELYPLLRKLAGYPEDVPLEVYEEIKFEPKVMCEALDKKQTLATAQLEDGDIICFQQCVPKEQEGDHRFPHVNNFLDYVKNRQLVTFKKHAEPKEEGIQLELSRELSYDDVTRRLADALGPEVVAEPHLLRLTQHNSYCHMPKPLPVKYRGYETLADMLQHYHQTTDILYYEVLDIPLPELERLKTLKILFHNDKAEEVSTYHVRLPKDSTVGDVLQELGGQLQPQEEYAGKDLRLLEIFYSRIYKVFDPAEKIDTIDSSYWTIRAEVVAEGEGAAELGEEGSSARLVHCAHFKRDPQNSAQVTNFGDPFLLRVAEDEPFGEVRRRIQAKLGVPDEEFSKWKFAVMGNLRAGDPIEDADLLAGRFQKAASPYTSGGHESYLGMEHVDNNPSRKYYHQTSRHSSHYERPIKIYS